MTGFPTSLLSNYGFQSVGRSSSVNFQDPDLSSYSRQKALPLVSETHDELYALDSFSWVETPVGASDVPSYLVRMWDRFFSRRVAAALDKGLEYPRLLSLFPGNTVLSPAEERNFRYRGSLAFEQFLELFQYSNGAPSEGVDWIGLKKSSVDEQPFWPWQEIAMPRLQFVTADYDTFSAKPASVLKCQKANYLEELYSSAKQALGNTRDAVSFLKVIHRAWSDTAPPVYSKFAISVVDRLLQQVRPRLDSKNMLPFLFELELFASYATHVSRIAPVASGWYSNTWLDVGFMPLTQIRATELCVRERLIDELFNLPARGFAPVVVNEFDSVADGNHRLTASWIWNILKHTMHTEWSLDNEEFKLQVRDYVHAHHEALGCVSLYETLKQLASFLAEEPMQQRLEHGLKPAMRRTHAIRKLPVIMLPEYSMGTVEKESYDKTGMLRRVPPSLYADLAQSNNMVLPPRASYHFTDAVPMPWFEVVKQRRFHHIRTMSENLLLAKKLRKHV